MRLLADEDHKVAEAFGGLGEKQNYGRTYMGIIRSTFIIEGGKIAKAAASKSTATRKKCSRQ